LHTPLQTDHVRDANRRAVFGALTDGEAASRAALAHRTGLSIPTVATILAELGSVGALRHAGPDEGTGGRPAQRVALDPDVRHVLAVDLSSTRARAVRVDLLGRVVATHVGPLLGPDLEEALVAWLAPLVEDARQPRVARVAVAVPGVVDPSDGHVDLAPALGWHDFALAELFERTLRRPVVLENDVNALALAELFFGAGAGHEHVVYLAIGSGVGAGLVVQGRLYRGAHAAAGEIGYAITPPPASGAGDETATGFAATEDPGGANAAWGRRGGPLERDLLALAARFMTKDGQLDVETSDRARAFDRFAEGLRTVLHNLVCALDPELLVVAWPADAERRLAQWLRERWSGPGPLRIVAGALGDDAAALGVARIALELVEDDLCQSAGRMTSRSARVWPTDEHEGTPHA
jgi:predicted NBD/HSP70 family sugar kinase